MAKRARIQEFSEDDLKSICSVAKNITVQHPFLQDDFDDVKQELCLGLYNESHKYRSKKSDWKTFRWKILEQIAGRIRRNRLQPSHRYMNPPTFSLNQPISRKYVESDDHPTLMECVSNNHLMADGNESDGVEQLGLVIDVRRFIETLPPAYQTICRAISEYGITEASRRLEIPPRTFRRRIAEIREKMVAAGLDAYLNH